MIERGVLYIVDPTTNGIKQHVLTLLKYLNRARYKPYLVHSGDSFLEEHAGQLDLDSIVIPEISNISKINLGGIVKQIEQFIEEKPMNLVHSHGNNACFIGAQVAKHHDIPHVSTVHALEDNGQKKKGLFSLASLNLSQNKVISLPNHLIAVSEVVKKYAEGLNESTLIYNGIEDERFAETLDTEHLYRELELPKDTKLVGTITRLIPDKGLKVFLEAAAELLKSKQNIRFVIAGDGNELDGLKDKAAKLGISNSIHFLGHRRDVAHILKSLDVVVIPNMSAGLPLILLEALASIKPVVITDVPGVREVVDESMVQFTPAGKPDALAKAIDDLLTDKDKATTKAQSGRKIIADRFTVKHMLKPTESLYLKVAG